MIGETARQAVVGDHERRSGGLCAGPVPRPSPRRDRPQPARAAAAAVSQRACPPRRRPAPTGARITPTRRPPPRPYQSAGESTAWRARIRVCGGIPSRQRAHRGRRTPRHGPATVGRSRPIVHPACGAPAQLEGVRRQVRRHRAHRAWPAARRRPSRAAIGEPVPRYADCRCARSMGINPGQHISASESAADMTRSATRAARPRSTRNFPCLTLADSPNSR